MLAIHLHPEFSKYTKSKQMNMELEHKTTLLIFVANFCLNCHIKLHVCVCTSSDTVQLATKFNKVVVHVCSSSMLIFWHFNK